MVLLVKTDNEYSFLGLILASLALSLQFSPGFGNRVKWLLVVSWVLYLASTFSGLYRIEKQKRLHEITLKLLQEIIPGKEKDTEKIEKDFEFMETLRKSTGRVYPIQKTAYILGLILNIIFASFNFFVNYKVQI